jgi:N-acyl-D-aspartate/D-glutamate deacylase
MATSAKRLVIKNGTLIDGTGKPPTPNGAIVEETRSQSGALPPQPGETVIDASGKHIAR